MICCLTDDFKIANDGINCFPIFCPGCKIKIDDILFDEF